MNVRPQTKAEIRRLLKKAGVRPQRPRGQSFLVDPQAMLAIVEAAELTRDDFVLEVGTGTAGLAALLAERAGAVLTIEIDRKLHAIAQEVLAVGHECPTSYDNKSLPSYDDRRTDIPVCPAPGVGQECPTSYDERRTDIPVCPVEMLLADVLAGKHQIDAEVMKRLKMGARRFARTKLVANFPYSIATPLVINLLLSGVAFERMVFTVQREVGGRMAASPGTREYGWVSVLVELAGGAEVLRNVPPGAFWPAPRVSSSLVRIFPRPDWKKGIDLDALCRVGPYVFQQRRKTIGRILRNYVDASRLDLDSSRLLADCELDDRTRGDQLTPAQVVRLANRIAKG